MNFRLRRWRIKLAHWEYWPWQVVYIPVFLYWIYLSLRSGSPLYFCAANPRLRNGGMLGVSKYEILRMIPSRYRPVTCLLQPHVAKEELENILREARLSFPVIAKPDVGERGFMVKKLHTTKEIMEYARSLRHPFMVQEYVELPLEAGIFYFRIPGNNTGTVSSVVLKKMLTVKGDGKRKLSELILASDRAFLQWEQLKRSYASMWDTIPVKDETIQLVSIGNHCLGTTFLNGNHLISARLEASMDQLAHGIEDFYYGRFDVRAANQEDLEHGRFMVLELNGAGAEPAHIYHPGASFWGGQKTLFYHWHIMFRISMINRRLKNITFPSPANVWREYKRFRALKTIRPLA